MLKHNLKLLVFGTSLLHLPLQNLAQVSLTDTLSDVTITSNRLANKSSRVAQSVSVISRKDINGLPGKVPADWLGTVSGVDVRQRGPVGVQADIGIRGGSFDQTLVLLNGMKLSDPQTGHHMFNLPLTNEAIEQVEVIKTSSSRIYGINALTGSINFVTKVPDSNQVYLGAFGGDFGLYGINAGAVVHYKNVGQHISFAKNKSDGYTTNTDFTTTQLFYQSTVKGKKGALNFTAGYTDRNFGAAGFYVATPREEYESIQTAFGGLQYDVKIKRFKIKAQVYYRYNEDKYIYLRTNPDVFKNKHFSHVAGGEIHVTYQSALGQTGVGLEMRNEDLNSNNLGKRNRQINGAFAEHKFILLTNRLQITPGVYVNQYMGNNVSAFPGIDISYQLKPSIVLYSSADRGMRLPTYTDLYYKNPPVIVGNASLKAEEAVSLEAGVKISGKRVAASVAGFRRSSTNLIDWARADATLPWQPLNVNHVNFNGVEGNAKAVFNTVLQQVSVGYTFIDADIRQTENYISRYTLSNIRHQVVGQVWFKWFKPVSHSISIRHINRVNMADYTLVDSKISYGLKNLNLYVDVMNIFDINYMEAGFVNMPGRWFKVGIDLKLNFKRF